MASFKNDLHDSFFGPDLIVILFIIYYMKNFLLNINIDTNGFYICENQSIENLNL